jgi:hypothetical protein
VISFDVSWSSDSHSSDGIVDISGVISAKSIGSLIVPPDSIIDSSWVPPSSISYLSIIVFLQVSYVSDVTYP